MGLVHRTPAFLAGQERELQEAVAYFRKQQAFFYDIESVGEHRGIPKLNTVTWISLSTRGGDILVPMGHPIGTRQIGEHREPRADKNGKVRMFRVPDYEAPPPQMDRGNVFEILEDLFMNDEQVKIAQNQPFDAGSIAKYYDGQLPHPPLDDTQLREWLINENLTGKLGIKDIVKRRFGIVWDKEDTGKQVEKHPFAQVAHYSYMDSHMGWLTYERQHADLEREYGEDTRIQQLEWDLLPVMCRMRLSGAPVDVPRLREMEAELLERLVGNEADVYQAAGQEFNINSNPQKQHILYGPKKEGCQGLKPWKLTDGARTRKKAGQKEFGETDYSTDDEALQSYPDNPVSNALRAYGDTNKLLSTYVQGWLGVEGNKKKPPKIFDGWIYTNFRQVGPVTGRFASSQPNLQNIPRPDDEDGKLIRGAVLAPDGWMLVVADLGQIEPRVLAHFLGRGMLYEGFLKGIDPYVVNAAAALSLDPQELADAVKAGDPEAKQHRQKFGKTLMLSMNYGQGEAATAAKMGIPLKHAQEILDRHETNMPEVAALKQAVYRTARSRKPPYIKTLLGRKRRLFELNSQEKWRRARAERQAFNSLIQGSAADLNKLGMVRADRMLAEQLPDCYLSLTVHDEIVALAPEDQAEKCRDILVDAMVGPSMQKLLKVPMTVDSAIVKRWSEAK